MENEYIIIGGGGHALSVANSLLNAKLNLRGYTAPEDQGNLALGIPWLGTDDMLARHTSPGLRLINGIGSAGHGMDLRRSAFENLKSREFTFAHLVHPNASVSSLDSKYGSGLQVLAGAHVNAGVHCGENVLINTGAIVEHGCRIGSHCHIASGAVLCGDVEVGESVHIGAAATVIQGIRIGAGAVIAAGTVVTQNVEPLTLIAGVPGKVKRKIEQ